LSLLFSSLVDRAKRRDLCFVDSRPGTPTKADPGGLISKSSADQRGSRSTDQTGYISGYQIEVRRNQPHKDHTPNRRIYEILTQTPL